MIQPLVDHPQAHEHLAVLVMFSPALQESRLILRVKMRVKERVVNTQGKKEQ
ncbi:hypothetical protein RADP37_05563 [Roseomonas mucosa]|uniref:Uncharacterized protein n=1 Tax=Roseomonas mucosa TaxID=207340 RepID=A0A4Y1MUR7_9PROT|nr:hypothetical protein RADP37_05563 [Roseomonas mucosa]MDT8355267.1 hypothetical protein [Roseomonas mucosa]